MIDLLPGRSICPFRYITGYPCPGCGMTRAFLSIGQGKPERALHYNPASIALFLAMCAYITPLRSRLVDLLTNRGIQWIGVSAILLCWIYRLLG